MGHGQEFDNVLNSSLENALNKYLMNADKTFGKDKEYDTKEERKNTILREHKYIRQINAWEQKTVKIQPTNLLGSIIKEH